MPSGDLFCVASCICMAEGSSQPFWEVEITRKSFLHLKACRFSSERLCLGATVRVNWAGRGSQLKVSRVNLKFERLLFHLLLCYPVFI